MQAGLFQLFNTSAEWKDLVEVSSTCCGIVLNDDTEKHSTFGVLTAAEKPAVNHLSLYGQ